ncbi:neurofilament medium polypeptide [Cocos nucifera]|uniref:Protein TILLER ANGLE CONTROL 1 n=1 Tax=Cocos nucifera TaxID=13894 RepID=A0A8K0IJJ5_COCNU|nr:neurofilament medium polypeptide [Cocos nucifera]
MKIFNWMHRKLHPSMSYSQVSQKKEHFGGETEKEEMVRQREGDRDTEALLLHDMLDGILTIGTLGHGHPCHVLFSQSNSPQEESLQKEQEKEEEDGDQEQQVLAVAAFVVEERKPMTVLLESALVKSPVDEEEKKMVQMVVNEEEPEKLLEEPLLKNKEKRERGRTTLAELFAADASLERRNAFKKSQLANPATRSPNARPKTNTPHKKKGANPAQANTTSTKLHRVRCQTLSSIDPYISLFSSLALPRMLMITSWEGGNASGVVMVK